VGRFDSTVAFYERARQPYGNAFFATVARSLGFDGSQRLLDLGTGPGLLALGFAPFVGEVIGVDPEPAMIAAARGAADRAGVRLRLVEGRAETLPANFGVFDVVTIGRALHWMEPEGARAALDQIVATHGQILICRAASVTDDRNPWLPTYDATRKTRGRDGPRSRVPIVMAGIPKPSLRERVSAGAGRSVLNRSREFLSSA
jgi:SAM-dependent methyltransferase